MKKIILGIIIPLILSSCLKKLDEKIITDNKIKLSWYRTSSITSVHDKIDILGWAWDTRILKSNSNNVYGVEISNDTITIYIDNTLDIYEFKDSYKNYHIQLDATSCGLRNKK